MSRLSEAALLCAVFLAAAAGKLVTIRNDVLRYDTNGDVVDCHSGMVLAVNNTYYMYGERYTNSTGYGPSPPVMWPKIVTYSSPDLVTWTYHGLAINNWPTAPYGTQFTPWAVYDKKTDTFVLWFNAYLNGCCAGNFGVATSKDGVNFTMLSYDIAGTYAAVDCNALFIDDDGTGYNFYTSEAQDHRHSAQVMTPDYTNLTATNMGLFPDHYVEGGILFKRAGIYYAGYGSCSCFGRNGSGWIVYSSPSISGPWVRQTFDLNCASDVPGDICGGYGERAGDPIIVNAQGIGLSLLPLADGSTAYVWQGERWLSAANNNPSCPDECRPESGICAEPADYIKGHGFSYWTVLQFSANGTISPLGPFTDSFTLDLADSFGVDHLPGPGRAAAGALALPPLTVTQAGAATAQGPLEEEE